MLHLVLKSGFGCTTNLVVLRSASAFEKLCFEVPATARKNRTFELSRSLVKILGLLLLLSLKFQVLNFHVDIVVVLLNLQSTRKV